MAHAPDKQVRLRAAYIGGLPLEAACVQVGVPLATARRWYAKAKKDGDDWERFQRASLVVSGGGVEQALGRIIAAGLVRCEALTERSNEIDDPLAATDMVVALADAVAKLRAASRGMMPEADRLAIVTDVLKRLGDFVRSRYPRHATALTEVLEPFAAEIARAYG